MEVKITTGALLAQHNWSTLVTYCMGLDNTGAVMPPWLSGPVNNPP